MISLHRASWRKSGSWETAWKGHTCTSSIILSYSFSFFFLSLLIMENYSIEAESIIRKRGECAIFRMCERWKRDERRHVLVVRRITVKWRFRDRELDRKMLKRVRRCCIVSTLFFLSFSAYHGHLTSMIDISPYKFNKPNGPGKKEWIHVVRIYQFSTLLRSIERFFLLKKASKVIRNKDELIQCDSTSVFITLDIFKLPVIKKKKKKNWKIIQSAKG